MNTNILFAASRSSNRFSGALEGASHAKGVVVEQMYTKPLHSTGLLDCI
jgi:hypothetical protein